MMGEGWGADGVGMHGSTGGGNNGARRVPGREQAQVRRRGVPGWVYVRYRYGRTVLQDGQDRRQGEVGWGPTEACDACTVRSKSNAGGTEPSERASRVRQSVHGVVRGEGWNEVEYRLQGASIVRWFMVSNDVFCDSGMYHIHPSILPTIHPSIRPTISHSSVPASVSV